ncbi:hypothetical protein [Rhizobium sp. FY34]|uniref:glucosamine inositolphosphorylceramide transferase family protein n=1 Tax=Rhizobium sp. FY34 TaxID=2562309 RepID=UPI0010BFCCAC|nr:hypothetical protein [Rhizobium sp. FY34]
MTSMAGARRTIGILVERAAMSGFVLALHRYLIAQVHCQVVVVLTDGPDVRGTALSTLLQLEKLVLHKGRACWADAADLGNLPVVALEDLRHCDVVIDLCAEEAGSLAVPRLQPLFNGHAGEMALASALFFDGTPEISVMERREGKEPRMVAQGCASLEAAAGIGGGMEAVWSRLILLLDKALSLHAGAPGNDGKIGFPTCPLSVITKKHVALRSLRMIAHSAAYAAYRLCCHAPHWRIGWRFADTQNDVWARRNLGGAPWSILPSPINRFLADPFPIRHGGRDYLFFEELPHATQKGIISYCLIDEAGNPGPITPVLEEPWHLSYPFLIEEDGQIFMIPEASLSGCIPLYRAVRFPDQWELFATLVSDVEAADATVIRHQGRLWMFAVTRQAIGGYSDTLAIWSADRLTGPWTEHRYNPVLIDDRLSRPAGNMVIRNGTLYRPVQEARCGYGTALNLMRIDRLDDEGFEQVPETHLRAVSPVWPGRKLHTLSGNGYIEAIDGSVIQPKSATISRLLEKRLSPRSV